MMVNAEAMPECVRVDVHLGSRSYPILIGDSLLRSAPRLLSNDLPDARFSIVADEAVEVYASELQRHLEAKGLLLGSPVFVPSGEGSKSFPEFERVCTSLLDLGLERNDAVIAIGGGVIGDLAGFAAATVKRGVRLVQVPTTLLAQVDSSVGGKTGINSRHGKNLLGAFHQPSLVLADLNTLRTLPKREFRAGYAEIVKYGVLGNRSFFDWLEINAGKIFALDSGALTKAVETSCRMKAELVAKDEFERGDRALLNLGHTFGHAVEAWAGYGGDVLHGEAVGLGMVLAAEFSASEGLCGASVARRLKTHLDGLGFATTVEALVHQTGRTPKLSELLHFMEQDKKIEGRELTLILLRALGDAFVAKKVPRHKIEAFLGEKLTQI